MHWLATVERNLKYTWGSLNIVLAIGRALPAVIGTLPMYIHKTSGNLIQLSGAKQSICGGGWYHEIMNTKCNLWMGPILHYHHPKLVSKV